MTIDGLTFVNDGSPNLGNMTFSEALIQSCDSVYYNLGYDMWQTDDNAANFKLNPHAPTQKMQQMELDWGFGNYTGIDLPEEAAGTIPTRQWLYWMWEDNAHKGQNWCKNGKANGSYVQQIEYDNCKDGWVWAPGQAAIAAIGQGYVTSTPLQLTNAYTALANGGTLYSPRIGEALVSPSGKLVQQINPPVIRQPAGRVGDACLHAHRAGRRGHPGHRGRGVRRVPAQPGLRGGQDRYRADRGQGRDLGVRLLRPLPESPVRGRRHAAQLRLRRRRRGARRPDDLGRHLRPGGPQGRAARRETAADPWHREGEGAAMSVGLPSRGWAGPRAGTFAPRRRTLLGRAFARGGVARSWDWPLFAVTCALTAFGTVLVWAATEPALKQAGLDPHTYLKKAILWAALGFVLMMATACTDYRRIRRWTPGIYCLSLLLLLAVLVIGQSVNGAKAWIDVPGGFQVEPSEFAKLGLILSAAWLLSRRNDPTGACVCGTRGGPRSPPPR